MEAYPSDRDVRRLAQWLAWNGRDIDAVTPAAAHLLAARLAVRRRAVGALLVLVTAGAGAMTCAAFAGPDRAASPGARAAVLVVLAFLLFALGGTAWLAAIRFGEARLAAGLPSRLPTAAPRPVTATMGPVRTAIVGAGLGLPVLIWSALAVAGTSGTLLGCYGLAALITGACAVRDLRALAGRPGLAVDAVSAAIDARLRSQDGAPVALPASLLWVSTPTFATVFGARFPAGEALAAVVSPLVLVGANVLAQALVRRRRGEPPVFGY